MADACTLIIGELDGVGKRDRGGVRMLKKIYQELVEIKKELQAIRSDLKFPDKKIKLDGKAILQAGRKATHDIDARFQE